MQITTSILGGNTIHGAFGFFWGHYRSMTDEKLNQLRKAYENLQVCIIDEISMVGADRLYDVNRRFREILTNQDRFGGICTLIFGDLMQAGSET